MEKGEGDNLLSYISDKANNVMEKRLVLEPDGKGYIPLQTVL